jgi:hypothetical protein
MYTLYITRHSPIFFALITNSLGLRDKRNIVIWTTLVYAHTHLRYINVSCTAFVVVCLGRPLQLTRTYNIILYVVVFVQTRSALMLFFLTSISSDISREKLRAYRGAHGIILYILYCCTRWTRKPNSAWTRLHACPKTHNWKPFDTGRRGLTGFICAHKGWLLYTARLGENVRAPATEKRELRD